MGEVDLIEIEKRSDQYPPQARQDILALTRELRRLSASAGVATAQPASPLFDALTGVLNGGAYGVRFAMARARATRYRKIFAVMSVDVDLAGPALSGAAEREAALKGVAERLGCCVRATDTLARVDDHHFAIILEDLTQSGHAERVKQNVQDALAEPMHIGDRDVVPATHVHLQFYPEPDGPVH